MRLAAIVLGAATVVLAVAALWLTRVPARAHADVLFPTPASASATDPDSAAPDRPSRERAPPRPLPPGAPGTVTGYQSPIRRPVPAALLPSSLDEALKAHPELERTIEDEDDRWFLDFKLKLLPRLDACTAGRIQTHGELPLGLQFTTAADGNTWNAAGVTLRAHDKNPFTDEETAAILECANQAFDGFKGRPVVAGENRVYRLSMTWFAFPRTEDQVYDFLRK